MKQSQPPLLLIDGDVIAYPAAVAAVRDFSFDGETIVSAGRLSDARTIVDRRILDLLERFQTAEYIIALTDSGENWRRGVWPLYKQNRRDKPRPLLLDRVRTYIQEEYRHFLRPTLEADDVLGILATSPGRSILKEEGERIICSVDKDMLGVPGAFYNLNSGELTRSGEREADRFHMFQTLTGDAADGYPGCPGVGAVKAGRILAEGDDYASWWPLVVAAYEKAGKTREEALAQAQIARICRFDDYDYKLKQVRPWRCSE